MAVLTVHVLAMSVWAGGFFFLFFFGKRFEEETFHRVLGKILFSTWISVAVLLVTGVYLTVYETPTETPLYSFLRLWLGEKESRAQFAAIPFGMPYYYSLTIKHYAVLASILATGWMTWRLRDRGWMRSGRIGAAVNAALACVIIICAVLLVYLHALSFAHSGGA